MVYLPTKLGDFWANVGKYSSTMEHMGYIPTAGGSRNSYIIRKSHPLHLGNTGGGSLLVASCCIPMTDDYPLVMTNIAIENGHL